MQLLLERVNVVILQELISESTSTGKMRRKSASMRSADRYFGSFTIEPGTESKEISMSFTPGRTFAGELK